MSESTSRLFQPIQLGRLTLQHRVVMPALTRNRIDLKTRVVGDDVVEHYSLRAAVSGTLLITECTYITPKDAAVKVWRCTPGAWSPEQIAGWKKVVDGVHARGSFILLQVWTIGREADPEILAALDPTFPYISASGIPVDTTARPPRAISREEIEEYVLLHANAATAAVSEAGFDGIEIDAGGGYLLDEFLKSFSNDRTDEYGGSPENRARFTLEVVDAVARAVGEDRVGLKITPWDTIRGTGGGTYILDPTGRHFADESRKIENEDPVPTFSYLVSELRRRHPDFAYIHVPEPRFGSLDFGRTVKTHESNDFLHVIWRGKVYISGGGYTRETGMKQADADEHGLIAFGRNYTSNPDLPIRLQYNIPLTPYERETFYAELEPAGYNTFGIADESKKILAARGVKI
ncbi:FMN-linked oxidoreductase [Peniophora sp. CONT]|nr:FMN-linked oxidoreductase [Peniophora sp. CONT]